MDDKISSLPTKIVEDLYKVGFPSEVAAASSLEREKWMVYNGVLFLDPETKKPREIDIHAVKVDWSLADQAPEKKSGNENKLISHLVIEVKKSSRPWVFFDNGSVAWPQIPPQNFKSEIEGFDELTFDDLKGLGMKTHRHIDSKLHKSFHVSFSDPSQPSAIYESLIKTTIALNYFKNRYGVGGYALHLFIPIVIFDGTLWSASLDIKKGVTLKKVDSLLTVFSRLVEDNNGGSYEEEQICEVVTLDSFTKYLGIIDHDNTEVYKAWTNFF